jgi:signal transduction histidine kinase
MQAELLQNKNVDKQDELNQIAETSRKAVSNMRDVVWSIDARNDLAKDLIDRMHEYLSELFDASPISFTFTKDVQNPNQSIDLFTRQNTYLIFKESLNNIAKHANATHVNIELVINASALKLAISNNGQSQTNPKPGMGLRNMEMRAKKMKAELTIDPENCYKLILLKKL